MPIEIALPDLPANIFEELSLPSIRPIISRK
jgi:hypothetical protein